MTYQVDVHAGDEAVRLVVPAADPEAAAAAAAAYARRAFPGRAVWLNRPVLPRTPIVILPEPGGMSDEERRRWDAFRPGDMK